MQTAEEQGERPQKLHKSGPSSPDVGVALSGNKTFSQDLSTLPRHVVSDSAEGLASFKCPSLEFTVLAKFGRARRGRLRLPHAEVQTPAFMPVGTHGTIKMIPCEIVGFDTVRAPIETLSRLCMDVRELLIVYV